MEKKRNQLARNGQSTSDYYSKKGMCNNNNSLHIILPLLIPFFFPIILLRCMPIFGLTLFTQMYQASNNIDDVKTHPLIISTVTIANNLTTSTEIKETVIISTISVHRRAKMVSLIRQLVARPPD